MSMKEELEKLSFPFSHRGVLIDKIGSDYLVLRQTCKTMEQVDEIINQAIQKVNDSVKPKVNY